eukprot:TRINITY_DN3324_c0_g1_i1.p2 TRINITY_DN3324_c0_g1~~TRINITY_DN3324_c0_g1_i1.p2  ORF type:complete len:180 (+),score=64.07 TRINITY_DN3324_c0_g1_i1:66-542(+)
MSADRRRERSGSQGEPEPKARRTEAPGAVPAAAAPAEAPAAARAPLRVPGGLRIKGTQLPVKGKKKAKPAGEVVPADAGGGHVAAASVRQPHLEDTLPFDRRTDAEIRADRMRRERLQSQAQKLAQLSYRERVAQYNDKLSKLSEIHDIPKVTYRTNK